MLKYTRDDNEPGIKGFFKKYINFRTQEDTRHYLKEFLLVFIVGVLISYFYSHSFSLHDMFIGYVNEVIRTLGTILSGNVTASNAFFLLIGGVYYFLFYYYFIMIVFSIFSHLDDKDTWIMCVWLGLITFLVAKFLPKIFNLI